VGHRFFAPHLSKRARSRRDTLETRSTWSTVTGHFHDGALLLSRSEFPKSQVTLRDLPMSVMRIAHIPRRSWPRPPLTQCTFDRCRPPQPVSLYHCGQPTPWNPFATRRDPRTMMAINWNSLVRSILRRARFLQGEEVFPYKTGNSLWLFLIRSSFAKDVLSASQSRSLRFLQMPLAYLPHLLLLRHPTPPLTPLLHLSFPSLRTREIGLRFASVDARGVPSRLSRVLRSLALGQS